MSMDAKNTAAGKMIMDNLVLGTGIGASATGLYYLARKLQQRLDAQIEKSKPTAPDYHDVALDVPALPAPTQKKLAFDAYTVATPLATGAAGAIMAAALSDKKTKLRNALLAGAAGVAGGAALNTAPVHKAIGENVPRGMYPFLFGGGDKDTSAFRAWQTIGGVGGTALGLGAGKKLYDLSVAPQIEAEKKKEQYDAVADARQKYFDELIGGSAGSDKKEKQSALDAALDAAYEQHITKRSSVLSWLRPKTWIDLATLTTAGTIAGTGVLGAKYMYDKTRSESKARNLAVAAAARERMKHSLPVWVDPKELAQVKETAQAKELSTSREA